MSSLVPYTTATALASAYRASTERIRELLTEVDAECDKLREAFRFESTGYGTFKVDYRTGGATYSGEDSIEDVLLEFRRQAWRVVIDKLGIMPLMSSKKQDELNEMLHARWSTRKADSKPLPELTEESIVEVIERFTGASESFFVEKVVEEFEFWRPNLHGTSRHKTNRQSDRVGKKVIRGYMVTLGWSGTGFSLTHTRRSHVIALDSIFHTLDGRGPIKTHSGPLVTEIESSHGEGETDFFRFKCFKNGNLHLEFKRIDLLSEFNRIGSGGSNRVGGAA